MSQSTPGQLSRSINLTQTTAMVVGTIIGGAIFVQPTEITKLVPSLGGVALIWLLAGTLTFFGALVCAELASAFPRTGGVYVFLNETYSPVFGFLWGWAMFWIIHSGIIAIVAVIFARYLDHFIPLGDAGIQFAAAGAILVLSAVNYRGVAHGSRVQTLFTIIKVLAIFLMIVVGVTVVSGGGVAVGNSSLDVTSSSPVDIVQALIAGLFAFGGWHMVTYAAGETIDPTRNIPRALMYGSIIVTVCYIALNAVYMYILPLDVVVTSTRVAADAADVVVDGGATFISGLVLLSTFGAVSGIILAGPRVYFSMARDGVLFPWAGKVHPVYRTPHLAIVLQGVWAAVLVFTGSYQQLFSRVIYVEWIFFGMMACGLFLLRRRPSYAPTYRIKGYPMIAGLFALSAAVIVVQRFIAKPFEAIIGLGIVLLGVPVYYLWAARRKGEATLRGDR
mgnify:FL=1